MPMDTLQESRQSTQAPQKETIVESAPEVLTNDDGKDDDAASTDSILQESKDAASETTKILHAKVPMKTKMLKGQKKVTSFLQRRKGERQILQSKKPKLRRHRQRHKQGQRHNQRQRQRQKLNQK